MCARDDMDKKNNDTIKRLIKNYPIEVTKYVDSMSRKTSFTKTVYIRYIIKFIDYVEHKLGYSLNNIENYNKIKPMDIDSYMEFIRYSDNGKEKSASFRAANLAAINSYFKFLKLNEQINNNPCEHVEKPKDNNEHEIITISDEDLNIMIDNIKNGIGNKRAKSLQKKWVSRDIALLMLGITTGLRVSAIVGIDMEDVCLNKKYITVTEKGNINKKIYLGDRTVKALKEWIKDRKYMVDNTVPALFICKGNKRMSTRALENRFQIISEQTGKKITPHKMRATCATRLYEETGDIYLVQQQLGHKSINNTQRYARVSEQRRREAADILNNLI